MDRAAAEREQLANVLTDNTGNIASSNRPQSWRSQKRKRSAAALERRELHFQQRELAESRGRQREQQPASASDPAAVAVFWAVVEERRKRQSSAAASGSRDPQPPSPSDDERSSWGHCAEEQSESEKRTDDEAQEADSDPEVTRLRQSLSKRSPPSPRARRKRSSRRRPLTRPTCQTSRLTKQKRSRSSHLLSSPSAQR